MRAAQAPRRLEEVQLMRRRRRRWKRGFSPFGQCSGRGPKDQLVELGKPTWGDKRQLWMSLQHAEAEREIARRREAYLGAHRRGLQLGLGSVATRMVPWPGAPSEEERRKHRLTHLPVADWCDDGVIARSHDAPRPRATLAEQLARDSVIQMDCAFVWRGRRGAGQPGGAAGGEAIGAGSRGGGVGGTEGGAEDAEADQDMGHYGSLLLVVDQDTGMRLTLPLEGKALCCYAIEAASSFIRGLPRIG